MTRKGVSKIIITLFVLRTLEKDKANAILFSRLLMGQNSTQELCQTKKDKTKRGRPMATSFGVHVKYK